MTEFTAEQIKENRRKWVEALRSGKYAQTRDNLRDDRGFCCLGVLADVAGCEWTPLNGYYIADGVDANAPPKAMEFVGLARQGGAITRDDALWQMNDNGCSFSVIASVIEREPEGLFLPS